MVDISIIVADTFAFDTEQYQSLAQIYDLIFVQLLRRLLLLFIYYTYYTCHTPQCKDSFIIRIRVVVGYQFNLCHIFIAQNSSPIYIVIEFFHPLLQKRKAIVLPCDVVDHLDAPVGYLGFVRHRRPEPQVYLHCH